MSLSFIYQKLKKKKKSEGLTDIRFSGVVGIYLNSFEKSRRWTPMGRPPSKLGPFFRFNQGEVDPFLCLVEDSKLKITEAGLGHQEFVYGSKEDDSSALSCLSEIKLTEDQTRESLVSIIIRNLGILSDSEECTIREQLLKDFVSDDLCSSRAQFIASSKKGREINSQSLKTLEKATSTIGFDDASLTDSLASSNFQHDFRSTAESPSFLSVDQLMQFVLDTAHYVGRISMSTAPDASYKEMANHCEALLMGKQQKMSYLVSTDPSQAFVSEYAVTGDDAGKGSLLAALSEPGFLIGLEKN